MTGHIALLDGGLGQELYRRAGQPAHPMWSGKVMQDQPELVETVQREFIDAGARILTVNAYALTPTRLARDGQRAWFEDLQTRALALAHAARRSAEADTNAVQIAGCLPPLTGSYVPDTRPFETLKAEYREIVAIQSAGVDLFLIETMSAIAEAQAATEAALEAGKPVLLAWTLSDDALGQLRSGESIAEAIASVADYDLAGLMFNCSRPEVMSAGLSSLGDLTIPYGGYANGFTSVEPLKPGGTVDALQARQELDEARYAEHVMDWINQGAQIVGGCCEVSPAHIARVDQRLANAGYARTHLACV
jgi:S-methylmethionine-dependent homocysteine/selenocysteine methylase